jgi:hypothetical protein
LHGSVYPLTNVTEPQPAPPRVISPAEAVRRFWELQPSVRPDQVYLQLLKVGVEQPIVLDPDRQVPRGSCFPDAKWLASFPVPIGTSEQKAPRDRFVWRMLAIRNWNSGLGQPYGDFLYLDAVTGQPLSPRGPAVRGVDELLLKLPMASPVPVYDFPADPKTEVPTDGPMFDPMTINSLALRQLAEAMDLGLRRLIARQAPDPAVQAAVHQISRWQQTVHALETTAREQGLARLEAAAREKPKDASLQATLAHRYVGLVARERQQALDQLPIILRFDSTKLVVQYGPNTALDPASGQWVYSIPDFEARMFPALNPRPFPSLYFSKATAAIDAALALDPKQPQALSDRARLARWETVGLEQQYPIDQEALEANPYGAIPRLLFATFPQSWNESQSQQADSMSAAHLWYTHTVELHFEFTIYRTFRHENYPTPEQIAGAERLRATAAKYQVWATDLRDGAMKYDPANPDVYFMVSRILTSNLENRDRVACDGLIADPGYPGLYALRDWVYENTSNAMSQLAMNAAVFFDAPPGAAECGAFSRKVARTDPLTSYTAALQGIRLAPTDPQSHLRLAEALERLDGFQLYTVELMPDALEQAQLEYAVVSALARSPDAVTLANADQFQDLAAQSAAGRNRCLAAIASRSRRPEKP